tara:strand:- start:1535 stop:1774 length:240 start_codon:yes stop_codon:yes gene_type:complete
MKKKYPYELIGQKITIIKSKNKDNLKISGKIVDETKYTIKVSHQGKIKTLMKNNITFQLNDLVIEGKTITKRSEERIKG